MELRMDNIVADPASSSPTSTSEVGFANNMAAMFAFLGLKGDALNRAMRVAEPFDLRGQSNGRKVKKSNGEQHSFHSDETASSLLRILQNDRLLWKVLSSL